MMSIKQIRCSEPYSTKKINNENVPHAFAKRKITLKSLESRARTHTSLTGLLGFDCTLVNVLSPVIYFLHNYVFAF